MKSALRFANSDSLVATRCLAGFGRVDERKVPWFGWGTFQHAAWEAHWKTRYSPKSLRMFPSIFRHDIPRKETEHVVVLGTDL